MSQAGLPNIKKHRMSRTKKDTIVQERELPLLPSEHNFESASTRKIRMKSLGVPRESRRLWTSDYVLTAICLQCFALAGFTVFFPAAAIWLGQVNQLISLGVLLQLMGICTQKQLQYFFLTFECLWNKSSLQNYESIVQGNFASKNTSLVLRLVIFLYVALPLGLGVAYKNFTGGETISAAITSDGTYGNTGQPGTKGLGTTGIALFENTTSPWWTDPRPSGTYGFNLFVESAERTALLDGPTEEHISQLRQQLKGDETLVLDGLVNSTVCDMVFDLGNLSRSSALSDVIPYFAVNNDGVFQSNFSIYDGQILFWKNETEYDNITDPVKFIDKYADLYFAHEKFASGQTTIDRTWNLLFGMIVPLNQNGWVWNTTFIMTSRWNGTNNETFGTYAQGYQLYYRQYRAQWQISRSSVKLLSAEATGSSNVYQPFATEDVKCVGTPLVATIDCNYSLLQLFYPRVFMDYDWKYLGDFNYHANGTTQMRNIKSDTVLVGAMVWSRLTTMWGLTNPFFNMTENVPLGFRIYSSPSTYVKTTPTLKRSLMLAAVLATNPIILLVTLIVRVLFLYNAPISKDFGFASLLASVDPGSLKIVKGAAYSGKLSSDVRLKFLVSEEDDELAESRPGVKRLGRVATRLEAPRIRSRSAKSRHNRIKSKILYL